ncbi:MAG: hypothetical protein AAB271_04265, partial [Nitrospirota bacterium]
RHPTSRSYSSVGTTGTRECAAPVIPPALSGRQRQDILLALPEMEWVKSLALGLLRRVPFSGASPS